ncbi:hypothetical protein P4S95_16275 [Aneurinibacillus aneurinilyticus]|uniref:hypothetical protein n=1 Tax=Aneurinibacillus aneurinilyticus TaxID=1391 RepID=UPI002E1DAF9A|nr:hypothetical protein [Aneurinibacillus aneurinilyticus]
MDEENKNNNVLPDKIVKVNKLIEKASLGEKIARRMGSISEKTSLGEKMARRMSSISEKTSLGEKMARRMSSISEKTEMPRPWEFIQQNIHPSANEWSSEEAEKFSKLRQEKFRREEEYKQNVLNALLGIEKNTANLAEIVTLIHTNTDKQDEIIELIKEMLEITKAKNQQEAESAYREVMRKVNQYSGDIETMQKLYGFGTMIWNVIKPML